MKGRNGRGERTKSKKGKVKRNPYGGENTKKRKNTKKKRQDLHERRKFPSSLSQQQWRRKISVGRKRMQKQGGEGVKVISNKSY